MTTATAEAIKTKFKIDDRVILLDSEAKDIGTVREIRDSMPNLGISYKIQLENEEVVWIEEECLELAASEQKYLGCYVQGTVMGQVRARGFVVVDGEQFLMLHDRQMIKRDQPIHVIWQFPKYLQPEQFTKLLGQPRKEQIDLILNGWGTTQKMSDPSHTEEYKGWQICLAVARKGRGSLKLRTIQIINNEDAWFQSFEGIPGSTEDHFKLGKKAIDLVELTLEHLPDLEELEKTPVEESIPVICGIPQIVRLKLEQLTIADDRSTQPRTELNAEVIEEYSEAFERGDQIPALKAMFDGLSYWLFDGYHRKAGAELFLDRVGESNEPDAIKRAEAILNQGLLCEVTEGTLQDAQWECLKQNINHGLRRSRADIPRIVELALRHPYAKDKSYRELASQVRIDPKTFKSHWDALAHLGKAPEPPSSIVVNRGGQTYKMQRPAPAAAEPKSEVLHDSELDREETSSIPVVTLKVAPAPQSEDQEAEQEPSPAAAITLRPADYVAPEPDAPETTVEIILTKESNEKYTPRRWRDFAETVFGEPIALDPASCELANRIIRAERIYTIDDNALEQNWACSSLWLNPPYSMPEVQQFAEKLLHELPRIDQAIVLVNACTETDWFQKLAASCDRILFPNQRINFWSKNDDPDNFKGQNEYRQAILYWGHRTDVFQTEGAREGFVVLPLKP